MLFWMIISLFLPSAPKPIAVHCAIYLFLTFNVANLTTTICKIFCFQRNLTEYYNAVDKHNMMVIFASMLYERRIVFTSKKLKRLSACVQSANDIIYPMIWQHIFIPVLPMSLIDYLLAPMPFLIGVPEEVFKVRNADTKQKTSWIFNLPDVFFFSKLDEVKSAT